MGRRRWLTAAIVAAAGASLGIAAAGDLGWQWASPLPPAVDLFRVVWAGNRYVAAGTQGTVATSPDGRSWSAVQINPSVTIEALAWGGGRLVAVGFDADASAQQQLVVYSATDPAHWSERLRTDRRFAGALAWNGGRFVIVNGGDVLSSPDGLQWTTAPGVLPADLRPTSLASNGTTMVLASRTQWYVSTDDLQWSPINQPPLEYSSYSPVTFRSFELDWDGTQFVAATAGAVATSADGSSWEQREQLDLYGIQCVSAAPEGIVVSGSRDPHVAGWGDYTVLFASLDGGETWVEADTPLKPPWYEDASEGLGVVDVAYGDAGWIGVGLDGDVVTSTNGIEWAVYLHGGDFYDVAESRHGAIAVGDNGICQWGLGCWSWALVARRDGPGTPWRMGPTINPPDSFSSVASDGDRFVALSDRDAATSDDGFEWTVVRGVSDEALYDIAWGHGLFVACGKAGTVATSIDGSSWSVSSAGVTEDLYRVLATDRGFYLLAADGTVLHSPDAGRWDALPDGAGESANGIAFGGDLLVAVGSSGLLRTYTEVEGWVDRVAALPVGSPSLRSIAWDGSRFAVLGNGTTPVPGDGHELEYRVYTLVSRDAVHWTCFLMPGSVANEISATSSGFVAVGPYHTLLEATDLGTLLELDPPVGRIPLSQPATLTVGIDEARDEPTTVQLGASSGAIEVPRLVTIPAGTTSVEVPIRGIQVEAGLEIRAELPDEIGGGVAISRLSVEAMGPRRPGGRRAAPAGEAEHGVSRPDPR